MATTTPAPKAAAAPAPKTAPKAENAAPTTPDLDAEDLKSRVAFAKPRNEAVIAEVHAKLGAAQKLITEAGEQLGTIIHVELPG